MGKAPPATRHAHVHVHRPQPLTTALLRLQKYNFLFEANQKSGSFYLQSKVYRAKETLEEEYEEAGKKTPDPESEKLQQ
jgi:hypothetical protein